MRIGTAVATFALVALAPTVPFTARGRIAGPGILAAQSGKVKRAAAAIVPADIMRDIAVIADDSMMGRDTPSPGLEKTAQYVADQFRRLGLEPAGDNGGWFQRYPIEGNLATAPNTVGMLEGTDPKLKDEYVVFSAHMDHIGISGGQADSVNNGADDDASGTAGIIALARAFSEPGARPRRSLIFVTVSGEEKGMWGSGYFVENPPVPRKQIVADVNFDMIGRGEADTVLVIGREQSDLGAAFDRVNAAHRELKLSPVPDPPPQRLYTSDHYSFARKGIPILKFGGPSHTDYHQVSDSPEKIDAEREVRILRLAFYIAQEVANADQRPQWNEESYKMIVEP